MRALAGHDGLILDFIDNILDCHAGNRSLFKRSLNTVLELYPVEGLPSAVSLDDHKLFFLNPFVTRKSISASNAFTPSADTVSICEGAGFYNLIVKTTAMGTTHGVTSIYMVPDMVYLTRK